METLAAASSASVADDVDRVITDEDWLADTLPTWGTDDEITNRWVFRVNHGEDADEEDEAGLEIIVVDQASIGAHGDGKTVELDLRGVVVDEDDVGGAEAIVQSLAARLMAQFGDPRRTWRGSVQLGLGVFGHLGAVYLVGSRFLRAYGNVGLVSSSTSGTAVAFNGGRVIEETLDYWGEGADFVFQHYGINAAGWAASAQVAAVVDPTTIQVDQNAYTPSVHPITGEDFRDVDGFFTGQDTLGFPPANRDAAAALSVASTDRAANRITFTGAHGLGVGDIVTPASYDLAVNRLYAYLSDAAGTLGATGDPAKEIS